MYPVSEKYIEAIRSPVREDRITGGIRLKDGTRIAVDDTTIIQRSLTVTRSVSNSSKFDIGTVNSAEMRIKIRDDSAYDHDFGGAAISLKYGIVTDIAEDGTKTWEDVPLPTFYVDGSGTTRKRNMVSLIAHDALSRLSVEKGAPPATSLYAALVYFCSRCNVGLAISESEFRALPNADITPDFSADTVQSCWDGVMWIAQTVNCCAFADYRGLVRLRQYKYAGDGTYDRLITGQERTTIEYSDTRTYLAYLQSYENDKVKAYSKVTTWTGTDAPHIREGALSLPKNPILQSLTSKQQAAINQSYLENRSYPTRYIKASGVSDPAIEPFDVVAFSGGNIDVGQIINVATQVTWKFRNGGTIYCASVDEYSGAANDADTVAYSAEAVPSAQTGDEEPIARLRPRSQLEKRVDRLESQIAGMSARSSLTSYKYCSDLSAQCNGITYTAEKDAATGLISRIADSAGHTLTPEIPAGITDVAMHNAAVFALAMARGLGAPDPAEEIIKSAIYRLYEPDGTVYTPDITGSEPNNIRYTDKFVDTGISQSRLTGSTSGVTLAFVLKPSSWAAYYGLLGQHVDSSGINIQAEGSTIGGAWLYRHIFGFPLIAGEKHVLIISDSEAEWYAMHNTAVKAAGDDTPTRQATPMGNIVLYNSHRKMGTRNYHGIAYDALIWDRALTKSEALAVAKRLMAQHNIAG